MSVNTKKANRLFLGFKDMADTLRYLQAYQDLRKREEERECFEFGNHREAILLAAIVTYSRPFKSSWSEQRADRRIDPNEIELFSDNPDLESLHGTVISMRDKAAAHADWEFHSTELVEVTETSSLRAAPRPFYGQGISVVDFMRLAGHVLQRCRNLAFHLDRSSIGRAPP